MASAVKKVFVIFKTAKWIEDKKFTFCLKYN
jgi:hypothetical protein